MSENDHNLRGIFYPPPLPAGVSGTSESAVTGARPALMMRADLMNVFLS